MTLFAVACAGIFPLLHVGRPWLAYWLLPYPNTMELWPQFRSPLVWDVFAVTTYALVSLMFWYVGLIPDLATMRDRATNKAARVVYGIFALGWRGAARHWERYETAYLLLAGLATPLVVSVHTVVSFDFAVGIVPGWHATVFPPYFVAGAVFAGFAMVMTLAIPLRKRSTACRTSSPCATWQNMAQVMLATGLIVAYGYMMEIFTAWYSGSEYEVAMVEEPHHRAVRAGVLGADLLQRAGPAAPVVPQGPHERPGAVRDHRDRSVNVGMWLERFIIVVTSLSQDFLPSSWDDYAGTSWDWALYIGTIGLFGALLFLFIRFLPMISIFEMRTLVPGSAQDEEKGDAR